MRFYAQGALSFLLLSAAANPAALAQGKQVRSDGTYKVVRENPDLQQRTIESRTLTVGEGLRILGTALDSRRHARSRSDCSHFVHRLYERAGFPYAYANSSELYAGIDEFRRVASPQPGDLAVWRGHAGIVINPDQHSFFSLLRSGTAVDSYDSPYWKRRGRPRFFRYIKAVPNSVLSGSIRTASLRPTVLGNTKPHELAAEDPAPDLGEESSSEAGFSAKPGDNQPMNTTTFRVPVVNSVRPKPDQLGTAFLQACTDSEESLRGRDLFKSAQSLIVFDHFEVRKVHIAGSQDWVDVRIDQLVSLTGSKVEVHRRSERQRWLLSRGDNTGWELTPPPNTIYLPQHIAVRILAHQLAQLAEDSPDTASRTQEKAELARLLNALLRK